MRCDHETLQSLQAWIEGLHNSVLPPVGFRDDYQRGFNDGLQEVHHQIVARLKGVGSSYGNHPADRDPA